MVRVGDMSLKLHTGQPTRLISLKLYRTVERNSLTPREEEEQVDVEKESQDLTEPMVNFDSSHEQTIVFYF